MHCQGVGCTPWRPLGSASFAWQAWDNVHCQGGRMYALASLGLRLFCVAGVQCALPRGRMYALASLGLRFFCGGRRGTMCILRGRRGTMSTAKDHYVGQCTATPWRSLGLRFFCVAGVGQCAVLEWTAKGSVRPGVPWAPPLLRGRRGTMCTAKGLEYALASLGLHLFCVAGASFTHSVTHSLPPLTNSLTHTHSLTLTH